MDAHMRRDPTEEVEEGEVPVRPQLLTTLEQLQETTRMGMPFAKCATITLRFKFQPGSDKARVGNFLFLKAGPRIAKVLRKALQCEEGNIQVRTPFVQTEVPMRDAPNGRAPARAQNWPVLGKLKVSIPSDSLGMVLDLVSSTGLINFGELDDADLRYPDLVAAVEGRKAPVYQVTGIPADMFPAAVPGFLEAVLPGIEALPNEGSAGRQRIRLLPSRSSLPPTFTFGIEGLQPADEDESRPILLRGTLHFTPIREPGYPLPVLPEPPPLRVRQPRRTTDVPPPLREATVIVEEERRAAAVAKEAAAAAAAEAVAATAATPAATAGAPPPEEGPNQGQRGGMHGTDGSSGSGGRIPGDADKGGSSGRQQGAAGGSGGPGPSTSGPTYATAAAAGGAQSKGAATRSAEEIRRKQAEVEARMMAERQTRLAAAAPQAVRPPAASAQPTQPTRNASGAPTGATADRPPPAGSAQAPEGAEALATRVAPAPSAQQRHCTLPQPTGASAGAHSGPRDRQGSENPPGPTSGNRHEPRGPAAGEQAALPPAADGQGAEITEEGEWVGAQRKTSGRGRRATGRTGDSPSLKATRRAGEASDEEGEESPVPQGGIKMHPNPFGIIDGLDQDAMDSSQ